MGIILQINAQISEPENTKLSMATLDWSKPISRLESTDNIGKGQLLVRSLSPGHLVRPNISMMQIPNKPKGTVEYNSAFDWGNVYNYYRGQYIIDCELLTWNQRILYTIEDGWEVGIIIPLMYRTGGIMDSVIDRFHRMLGLGNAHRDERPKNDVLLELNDSSGNVLYRNTSNYVGFMDIPIFVSWLLTKGDQLYPAVSFHAGLSLPIGDESEWAGLGKVSYGVGVLTSKRLGNSSYIVGTGLRLLYSPQKRFATIDLYSLNYNVMLFLEYEWSSDLSLVVEYLYGSPIAKDFDEFSDPIHEIHLGLKYQIYPRAILEFSLMENLFNFNNSTDFGVHLGVSWFF